MIHPQVDQLVALWVHSTSCFRWPSLRSSPSAIRCASGPRSGPVPHLHKCVLYRNIHSRQDCLTLQECFTSLGQWEADWQMEFNVAKFYSMRMTQHQHHNQSLFDQTLENVQSTKYLGITITDNMDWGQHASEISSKATKTLGFLRRNLAFAPRSTKEVAYKTLVWP